MRSAFPSSFVFCKSQFMDPSSPLSAAPSPDSVSGVQLLSSLPVAVYLCDMKGKITFYNAAAVALWGKEPSADDCWCGSNRIFTTDGLLMLPESYPTAIAIREKRAVEDMEMVIERPDGTRINVVPRPRPVYDETGNMCGTINLLIDMTSGQQLKADNREFMSQLERTVEKRTEKLRKSEEQYHKMIDEIQDYAILMLDVNGNILNWNRGAESIKGYDEDEIVGRNFRVFYREEDVVAGLPDKLIAEAAQYGKAMHEGWRLRKDGSTFWGYIVITALHDKNGKVIGFSKVTRDLTEKKKSDDRLKAYAEDIALRNKQLEEFAYIASHDLQEPLRKIQTFADILRMKIEDKEAVVVNADKISNAAQRMSLLIKDVLKYSQLSATDTLMEPVDLNEVLAEVLGDFELQIHEKGVKLTFSPLPVVKGIPIQLRQLFANLVSNAIKFSDKDDPIIDITAQHVSGSALADTGVPDVRGHYVKIAVRDNGIGFSQDYAEHVFKLFKRLNNFSNGTGIGLALCRKIVDNHYGQIHAESQPGQGATFYIYLPI